MLSAFADSSVVAGRSVGFWLEKSGLWEARTFLPLWWTSSAPSKVPWFWPLHQSDWIYGYWTSEFRYKYPSFFLPRRVFFLEGFACSICLLFWAIKRWEISKKWLLCLRTSGSVVNSIQQRKPAQYSNFGISEKKPFYIRCTYILHIFWDATPSVT